MSTRPNILLLTADDMDVMTPGAFGGPAGVTPRLDRLAAQGVVFSQAHVAAAVCQPSRSAIMTGLWPHHNGAEGFEPIDDGIPVLNDFLREANYVLGILGKVDHIQPVERFGWDVAHNMRELGLGRNPELYRAGAREVLGRAHDEGRPWFLMANAHDPHRPFHDTEDERGRFDPDELAEVPTPSRVFDPDELDGVPGFLPDLPDVRHEYAHYLSSSRRCDDVVGAVLDTVDEYGDADNTLVVFLSDNGMAFPFAKANCYVRSSRTPMILRWPEKIAAGARYDELVSALDLFPTFCDAAGIGRPTELDGQSLLPRLLNGAESADEVISVFHETSAKRRFEMRTVQVPGFRYIWNGWSDGVTEYRAENMIGETWAAMQAAAQSDPEQAQRNAFYLHRVPEELYNTDSDPDCLVNLAQLPEYREQLQDLRGRLREWMTDTGDVQLTAFEQGVS